MTPVHLSLHELSQLVVLQYQGGSSRGEIVRVLVGRGWPEVAAVRFVNLTLTEQRERSAPEEEQPTHQTFSTDQESWKALVVAVFLVAVFIACMVASQVH